MDRTEVVCKLKYMTTYFAAGAFITYIIVVISLALYDKRLKRPGDYMIAHRGVNWFGLMASAAGNLRDGAGLAAWMILGIAYGWGALWLTTGLACGLLLLIYLAPKARAIAQENDIVTPDQLIRFGVGPIASRLSVLIILATSLLYSAAQVNVVGRLFSKLFNVGIEVGVIITILSVATYLLIGGFKTTITTGIFQWLIIMLIVTIPWILPANMTNNIDLNGFLSTGIESSLAFFLISFLVVATSSDLWQVLFSSSSDRQARIGFLATIPVYYLISSGLIILAGAVHNMVGVDVPGDVAFFELFTLDTLAPWISAVLGVFVIAAVMSTLDSQVFLFTSSIATLVKQYNEGSMSKSMEHTTQVAIVVTFIVLGLAALTISDLVTFLFSAVSLATVLLPAFVLSVLLRCKYHQNDLAVSGGIIVSVVLYVWMFISGAFSNLLLTSVPAITSTLVVCLFMLLIPRVKKSAGVDHYN